MARRRLARLWATLFAAQALFVGAVEVRFERVAENVHAHVGDIGVVVTPAGPVLIGPPYPTAAASRRAFTVDTLARQQADGSGAGVEQCRPAGGPEPDAGLLDAGVATDCFAVSTLPY